MTKITMPPGLSDTAKAMADMAADIDAKAGEKLATISEPGFYQDFDEKAYHADPCPEPSASRSIVKTLVERTPRHAFISHPRLDPNFERDDSDPKFDLGTAVHTAMLTRGKKIVIGDFKDYRTDAAKAWRDQARAAGLTPILAEQAGRVTEMCAAITEQLPDHGLEHLFQQEHGRAEVMAAWVDPVGGWSRMLIDWLGKDLTITDLKTTEVQGFDPDTLGRHMDNMGYEFQHAFYERGLEWLVPHMAGRVKFRFLFCEVKPPYAIMPVMLPADALAKGRDLVALGMQRWAQHKASGIWPRYTGGDMIVNYPPWSTAEWAS